MQGSQPLPHCSSPFTTLSFLSEALGSEARPQGGFHPTLVLALCTGEANVMVSLPQLPYESGADGSQWVMSRSIYFLFPDLTAGHLSWLKACVPAPFSPQPAQFVEHEILHPCVFGLSPMQS